MKTLPGKPKFMCLEEFRKLIFDSGLDKEIKEKSIQLLFNHSMMTQVDELFSYRIFEMCFVEFIEVFARFADAISLPSLYYEAEDIEAGIEKAELEAQPLCLKIEALLVKFMHTVVPWNTVMKYYPIPKESCFTEEGNIKQYQGWQTL